MWHVKITLEGATCLTDVNIDISITPGEFIDKIVDEHGVWVDEYDDRGAVVSGVFFPKERISSITVLRASDDSATRGKRA